MTNKSRTLTIFKRLLDLGIGIYLLLIPIIIITGGFKINLLGIPIKVRHLYTPFQFLVPLVLIRLTVTVEIKNVLLMLGAIFLSLLVAETSMRLWDPPIAKPGMAQIHRASSVLDWEHIPGSSGIGRAGTYIHINSAGFRDTEHSLNKQVGIRRIMVIGDSFTFGSGVNLEDTYAKQLEQLLQRANISCEVINCGVIGYRMWQNFEVLKRKVVPYQPGLVILGVFLNDIAASRPPYKDPTQWKGHNPFEKDASGIMSHVHIWNFLRNWNCLLETKYRYRRTHHYLRGIEERKKWVKPEGSTSTWHKIMYGKMEERAYSEFVETMQEFVSTARCAGSKVLVVMIPDAAQLHETDRQAVNRFVKKTCNTIAVPFVDITPRFEKESDPKPLYLFPLDAHTSPQGHRLIAETIAEQIEKLGLLSS
jgi:lysophospholipase L1-like esterase